jgi:hypothetical protein
VSHNSQKKEGLRSADALSSCNWSYAQGKLSGLCSQLQKFIDFVGTDNESMRSKRKPVDVSKLPAANVPSRFLFLEKPIYFLSLRAATSVRTGERHDQREEQLQTKGGERTQVKDDRTRNMTHTPMS